VTAEGKRLEENTKHQVFWKKWGPYLSERQDYSPNGDNVLAVDAAAGPAAD
jgi:hypothetical protein